MSISRRHGRVALCGVLCALCCLLLAACTFTNSAADHTASTPDLLPPLVQVDGTLYQLTNENLAPEDAARVGRTGTIKHQLDEDRLGEQMTMFGKDDNPFKGGK